jgi:predicted ATPase
VIGLAGRAPLALVFEDIHWADPSTYEWLVQLIEAISGHAVLFLLTSRPAQFQELSGLLNMTHLSLNRLDRQGGLAMVEEIAGAGVVPDDVRNAIVDRGDGIPLFIEELTKSVLEMRIGTPADEPPRSFADALDLVIPATLQDLIMARLDRLDIDKEVLQVAACIGRQFSHALLAATVEVPQAALHSALEQLVANGTVFTRGTPPESDYLFRHALIRDAIYVNLLRREREQIHRRIATVLDRASQLSVTPERASLARNVPVEGDAGQIAYHYREAGIWDKALRFFVIKGRKAYAEYANLEAAEAFALALSALEKMGFAKENEQATLSNGEKIILGY